MKARVGESSNRKVISAWPFKSSQGTTTYETVLHEDGILTCNCPGWTRAVNKETGLRGCKHVKQMVSRAQLILDGKVRSEFVKSDGGSARVVERVVEKIVEKIVIKEVQKKEPVVEFRGGRRLLRALPESEV